MTSIVLLRFVLAPLGGLIATALIHAILTRLFRLSVGAQAAALGAIAVVNIGIAVVALSRGMWEENPWGLAYVLLVYNALALCYFLTSNTSETSLHIHIIMEILLAGELSREELASHYSAKHMIEARIERMISVGQLCTHGDRYILAGRGVLMVGRLFDGWRRILAMPTSPE